MVSKQALINQSTTGTEHESTDMQRRTLIGGAMAALLLSSGRVMAQGAHVSPDDPFILLLKGVYQPVPVGQGPADNLGLTTFNLNDGSFSRTLIYPVFGVPESREQGHAIGNFYVRFGEGLCAYDLPGGAIAMRFTSGGFTPHPDGVGGTFLEGTFELTILEATGVYSAFRGGHNHMVDRLHHLANGQFDEFCFCIISQYPFP
jgi:hypothetical protein